MFGSQSGHVYIWDSLSLCEQRRVKKHESKKSIREPTVSIIHISLPLNRYRYMYRHFTRWQHSGNWG